jgi:uncharacterized protein
MTKSTNMAKSTSTHRPATDSADAEPAVTISLTDGMADIAPADWDRLANPDRTQYDPFLSHAFLNALEQSGSISAETGWLPRHLLLNDASGALTGAMPLYVKSHSYGEFVFDHGWADAYQRAGRRYYPKLLCAVPVTPVPGRRLLVAPGPEAEINSERLLAGAVEVTRRLKASSLHITFPTEPEFTRLGAAGMLQRLGTQYHWTNQGFGSFDDFLATLASRKRKNLKRERRDALETAGITVDWITGKDLTEAHWDAFFEFYTDTGNRKWGSPYLNRQFFSLLGQVMADDCLLVMAKREGRYIAGALNMIGGQALYGRYWGCIEHHPFLHFELCYYQAIDFAIARKLARVEAGAGGEHKLVRGYLPVHTYSNHWIADDRFRDAIADYLDRERDHVEAEAAALEAFAPFKKG